MTSPITIHVRDYEHVTSGSFEPEKTYRVDIDLTFDGTGERLVGYRILQVTDCDGGDYGRTIDSGENKRLVGHLIEEDETKRKIAAELAARNARAA